jgi:hypothetical protein
MESAVANNASGRTVGVEVIGVSAMGHHPGKSQPQRREGAKIRKETL